MKIIKLNAIDSTNSFLKELERKNDQKNYTTVVTDIQIKGRGQMHTAWLSEPYKNLTFSTLMRFEKLKTAHRAYLSFAISLAIIDTLRKHDIPDIKIKWPNDILSGNRKICGVLIENTISKDRIINSIAGVGLNVNQEHFDQKLDATSMIHFLKNEINLDDLLLQIVKNIKQYVQYIELEKFTVLKDLYLQNLYRMGIPTAFKDTNQQVFMGIIKDVTDQGCLVLELEDESLKEFDLKEVSLARA